MRSIYAIARKEFLSFFFAPMAYIVTASFLVMNGFLFSVILAALSQPGASSASPMALFFGGTLFFWIFMILMAPVLTMRLGAEERKTGTLETLLTAPVSDAEVILGKYLGALAMVLALWLPTLLYCGVLSRFSEVDWGTVGTGYLGVWLVSMFFTAVGLFTSLATRNQLVAAILAFGILVLLLLVSILSFLITDPLWKGVLDTLDLWALMQNFGRGVVDSRAVVYCLSGAALFLALAHQALQARRWK